MRISPPRRDQVRAFLHQISESVERTDTSNMAAVLAFWSLLALFPFAILVLTLVGYLPLRGLDAQLMDYVHRAMPGSAAALVERTIHEIIGRQRGWLLVVSLAGSLWSASGGVSATITALNRAYDVRETRPFWRTKLLSLAMTIAAAAMIVLANLALIIGPELAGNLARLVGLGHAFAQVWSVVRWPLIIVIMTFMLAIVYYFLPNVKQRFRIISPGAVVAVLLWIAASLGFSVYVAHFNTYAKTYGALGAAVILMMWLYISGAVVILGSQINAILDFMKLGIRHTERYPSARQARPLEQPRRSA